MRKIEIFLDLLDKYNIVKRYLNNYFAWLISKPEVFSEKDEVKWHRVKLSERSYLKF